MKQRRYQPKSTMVDFKPRIHSPDKIDPGNSDEIRVFVNFIGLDQEIETIVEKREQSRSLFAYFFWLLVGFLVGWLYGVL